MFRCDYCGSGDPRHGTECRGSSQYKPARPKRFILTIELGNDAMQTYQDVHDALRKVADFVSADPGDTGNVRDANGNTVGKWSVTE